jgi:hypothetical protein
LFAFSRFVFGGKMNHPQNWNIRMRFDAEQGGPMKKKWMRVSIIIFAVVFAALFCLTLIMPIFR